MEFEIPGQEEPQYEEQSEAQEAPEAAPEAPEETPEQPPEPEADRLARTEQALAEVVEYLRATSEERGQRQAQEPPKPQRPRPNFGENTVASAIWDRIEESDRKFDDWRRQQEEEKRAQIAVQTQFAELENKSAQYIEEQAKNGLPKVSHDDLKRKLLEMGQLGNRRVPIERAVQDAYRAVAWDAALEATKNRAVNDARKPTARVPASFTPAGQQQTARRPQAPSQQNSKPPKSPVDSRAAQFTREMVQDALDELGGGI